MSSGLRARIETHDPQNTKQECSFHGDDDSNNSFALQNQEFNSQQTAPRLDWLCNPA
jgi:hypothetical protein